MNDFLVSFDPKDKTSRTKALQGTSDGLSLTQPIQHSIGSSTYYNVLPGISVRDEYTRRDYNAFRPEEASLEEYRQKFIQCNKFYKNIGLIKNIIDLMADFGSQGIEITSSNKTTERIINMWAKRVHFKERSERFLNLLYRLGNVVCTRSTAQLNKKQVDKFKKSIANLNKDTVQKDLINESKDNLNKYEIPWIYTFRNPATLDILGGDLALLIDKYYYSVRIPQSILSTLRNPSKLNENILAQLPEDIYKLIKNQQKAYPLDPNKTIVAFYKKDDWEVWADPMIASISEDIVQLSKMKLADTTALDSAISYIRVWKLGNIEKGILPGKSAFEKLSQMLVNSTSGGAIDLIWTEDLELTQTSTEITNFLGNEKYVSVLNAIYAGLGIPATLTGNSDGSGLTNNAISLKTLVERLEYGRNILIDFWMNEIKLVQKSLGLKGKCYIRFSKMNLSDEAAEKALLIQLADRNLITVETLQQRFGEIPEVENIRAKKQKKKYKKGLYPEKLGPYASHQEGLERVALQTGVSAPSEVGLELKPLKTGEKPALKMKDQQKKKTGVVGQGRPKNSKDKNKRKQKRVLPRSVSSFANMIIHARDKQKYISDYLTPVYLKSLGKKNLRMLSDSQFKSFEQLKNNILFSVSPSEEISEDKINQLIQKPVVIPEFVQKLCSYSVAELKNKVQREITVDELRQIYASVYALYNTENDNGEICG